MTVANTPSEDRGDSPTVHEVCPACGEMGSKVKRMTLDSLLRPERRGDIIDAQYYVCPTPHCDVVYFRAGHHLTFDKSDLSVRFGLKETERPRPICYCFEHSAEEIRDEIRRTGECTVVARIKSDMKRFGCRCEYTNPLGGCCLKSVQAVVADAFRTAGHTQRAATVENSNHGDCCVARDPGDDRANASRNTSGRSRAGAVAATGSVLAAILSSACCWLPLVLIAFGVSAAGVAGFFEAYRVYFIVGAVGLLAFGFYTVYFRNVQCDSTSACVASHRKLKMFNRVMLWTATVLVGAFIMFPKYVGFVLGSAAQASAPVENAGLITEEYHIEGMSCEACAGILHDALIKLPEVKSAEVDFARRTAVVHYDADNPLPPDRVVAAVKSAGYTATHSPSGP